MNGRRRQRFGAQWFVYCVVLLLVFEGSNAVFNKDGYEQLKKFNKNVKKTDRITKGSNRSLRGNSKFTVVLGEQCSSVDMIEKVGLETRVER